MIAEILGVEGYSLYSCIYFGRREEGESFNNQIFYLCKWDYGSYPSGSEDKPQLPQIPSAPSFMQPFSTFLILYQDLILAFCSPSKRIIPLESFSIFFYTCLTDTRTPPHPKSHCILYGIANKNFMNILFSENSNLIF